MGILLFLAVIVVAAVVVVESEGRGKYLLVMSLVIFCFRLLVLFCRVVVVMVGPYYFIIWNRPFPLPRLSHFYSSFHVALR